MVCCHHPLLTHDLRIHITLLYYSYKNTHSSRMIYYFLLMIQNITFQLHVLGKKSQQCCFYYRTLAITQ